MIPNSTIFNFTVQAAEKVTGVDADYIVSSRRIARVCRARIAVIFCLYYIGWPAQRIAKFFRGMDGKQMEVSTVTHGIKRAKKLREEDFSFSYLCDQIKNLADEEKKSVRTVSMGLRYTR